MTKWDIEFKDVDFLGINSEEIANAANWDLQVHCEEIVIVANADLDGPNLQFGKKTTWRSQFKVSRTF